MSNNKCEGTCGSCRWCIDEEGTLIISPIEGTDGVLNGEDLFGWPWKEQRELIKKVTVRQGVKSDGCLNGMFSGFKNCFEFDVEALDISRAETLHSMFNECRCLTDISFLAGWDTSHVGNMSSMFRNCRSLENISALAKWDVSHVDEMFSVFFQCESLKDLSPLKGWDTSRVRCMRSMFSGCGFKDVNALENWEMSHVQDMYEMFSGCLALEDISGLATWKTTGAETMSGMFAGCSSLADVSALRMWDMSEVRNIQCIFDECPLLPEGADSFITGPCPKEGAFEGWRECRKYNEKELVLVKFRIPEDAQRFSPGVSKNSICYASKVEVLGIFDMDGNELTDVPEAEELFEYDGLSFYPYVYKKGMTLYDKDMYTANFYDQRCTPDIWFYLSRETAAAD